MNNVNCKSVRVEELDSKDIYLKTNGSEKFKPTNNKEGMLNMLSDALGVDMYALLNSVSTEDSNYESKDKMVSHPPHYQSETGLEVIDVIEAFTFDLKGIEATDTGNVIKYICRWKQKNGLQDLEKAKWYLQHLINHIEKLEKENECYE